MFRKRRKKTFPPGTFISTPARVAAIIQLCLAFSLLLWILSQPFMGDLYTIKSQMLLYETVMDQKNVESFKALSGNVQKSIVDGFFALKKELQQSFMTKIERSIELLFFKTAPWELAWLCFSIAIPILLLKRVEGAIPACWVLVALTLGYGIDSRLNGSSVVRGDTALFPTENVLEGYLKEPLSAIISEQQKQLLSAWQLYLVEHWAKEKPAKHGDALEIQIKKGEFAFTVARIEKLGKIDQMISIASPPKTVSIYTLGLYFFWNLFFALTARKAGRKTVIA